MCADSDRSLDADENKKHRRFFSSWAQLWEGDDKFPELRQYGQRRSSCGRDARNLPSRIIRRLVSEPCSFYYAVLLVQLGLAKTCTVCCARRYLRAPVSIEISFRIICCLFASLCNLRFVIGVFDYR